MPERESLQLELSLKGLAAVQADLQRLGQSILQVGNFTKAFAAVAAAGFGFEKIVQATREVFQAGNSLALLQAQTGASIPTLMAFQKALRASGQSAEEAGVLLSHMQRAIADAADNGGEALRVFQNLNLDISKLAELDAGRQFQTIGTAIAQMDNPARRTAAAMQIFGRAGHEIVGILKSSPTFNDPSTFATAMSRSAGMFAIMSRSLGEMALNGQRFFTGFLDMVGPAFQNVFQRLADIDLTALGQKVGSFFGVVIQSIKDDKFPEMLSLLVEAGFWEAGNAVRAMFTALFKFIGSDAFATIFVALVDGIMRFGVTAAETLIFAFHEPASYLRASFDWLFDHLRELAEKFGQTMKVVFAAAMNFWAAGIENLVKKVATNKYLNAMLRLLPGGEAFAGAASAASGISLGRMDVTRSPIASANSFQSDLAASRKMQNEGDVVVYEWLEKRLKKSEEILAVGRKITAGDNLALNPWERLNKLMADFAAKRAAAGLGTGGVTEHPPAAIVMSTRYNDLLRDELAQKERLVTIEDALGMAETDFSLTAVEKWNIRKRLLEEEKATLDKIVADMRQRANLEELTNPMKAEQIRGETTGFEKQSGGVSRQIGQLGASPTSFTQQWTAAWTKLRSESQITWQKIAETMSSTLGTAIDSLSQNFTKIIMKTETWAQALRNIGNTIISTILDTIIKAALSATIAWAVPAILSTIASAGSTAAAAPGEIASVMTVAFAQGGYTGDGGTMEPAGMVHRGEFVMPASSVQRIGLPQLEAMKSGGSGGNMGKIASGGDIHLHVWPDEGAAVQAVKTNSEMQHAILGLITANTHKFIPRRM